MNDEYIVKLKDGPFFVSVDVYGNVVIADTDDGQHVTIPSENAKMLAKMVGRVIYMAEKHCEDMGMTFPQPE